MNPSIISMLANPANRRVVAAVLAGVLVFSAGLWWLLRTDYATLDIPEQAREETLAALRAAGIDYRDGTDGKTQVPAAQLQQAQGTLNELGLAFPEPHGFELLDKNSDYTASDFAQRLHYQRALEGELARTLSGLQEVRSARVHLSIARPALFSANRNTSKASVALQLKPGMTLPAHSAEGIREIVASSVEGLKPEQVSIVDDSGQPLAGSGGTTAFDQRVFVARKLETDLEHRVRRLLQESYGVVQPYVSVRADMNFDKVTSVRDGALPTDDSVGMLTREQIADSTPSADNSGTASSSTATREYIYGKERVETEFASGRVERLSIAIALPASFASALQAGGTSVVPATNAPGRSSGTTNTSAAAASIPSGAGMALSQQLAMLEQVVGASIGLQPERGDKLVISIAPGIPASAGIATNDARSADNEIVLPAISTTGSATSTADSSANPGISFSSNPFSSTVLLAILLGIVCAAVMLWLARRRVSPADQHQAQALEAPRMNEAQREKLLIELGQWLRTP